MICNTRKPNPDKLKFATDKRIPAVHASWLWECISAGRVHPYDKYLINTTVPQPQKPKPQASLPAVPTAPLSEKDSFQLQKKMQKSKYATKPRGGVRQPGSLELSNSRPPTPASTSESLAHPQENTEKFNMQEDAQLPMQYDGVDSLPLQDIHPSVNSPRRPSTSSSNSTHPHPKVPTIEAPIRPLPAQRQTRRTKEPSPDSVIPAGDSEILPDNENHKSPETDYTDMMSKLLANRKTSVPAEKEDTTGRRKRRPLGRAQSTKSNTSTAEELLSRNSSASHQQDEVRTDGGTTTDVVEPEVIVEEVVETRPFEIPQPSQELGWDSPGAQRARENMIRAVGGKVIEKKGLERGGVVKDKVEAGVGAGGRTARRRRG
jgi:DNA replication regulator DPB11